MVEGPEAAQEREEEEEVIGARGVCRVDWHGRGVRCDTRIFGAGQMVVNYDVNGIATTVGI